MRSRRDSMSRRTGRTILHGRSGWQQRRHDAKASRSGPRVLLAVVERGRFAIGESGGADQRPGTFMLADSEAPERLDQTENNDLVGSKNQDN
jgi:hypothetical protein